VTLRSDDEISREGEWLYEQYAKPLEAQHAGHFIAVSPDGRTILGDTMLEVAKRAASELGHGHFLFKLGPRSFA
jgi:hypothetical protein